MTEGCSWNFPVAMAARSLPDPAETPDSIKRLQACATCKLIKTEAQVCAESPSFVPPPRHKRLCCRSNSSRHQAVTTAANARNEHRNSKGEGSRVLLLLLLEEGVNPSLPRASRCVIYQRALPSRFLLVYTRCVICAFPLPGWLL